MSIYLLPSASCMRAGRCLSLHLLFTAGLHPHYHPHAAPGFSDSSFYCFLLNHFNVLLKSPLHCEPSPHFHPTQLLPGPHGQILATVINNLEFSIQHLPHKHTHNSTLTAASYHAGVHIYSYHS